MTSRAKTHSQLVSPPSLLLVCPDQVGRLELSKVGGSTSPAKCLQGSFPAEVVFTDASYGRDESAEDDASAASSRNDELTAVETPRQVAYDCQVETGTLGDTA